MTSISLRREIVPLKSIVLRVDSATPTGYSRRTALNDKYIIGTASAATNPGTSSGATTHTHSSDGGHTHTSASATSHTHTIDTNNSGSSVSASNSIQNFKSLLTHHHPTSSNSDSPSVSGASSGAHTHSAQTNSMAHVITVPMEHTETSIGLRRRSLDLKSIIMWGSTVSPPSRFTDESSLNNQHIKWMASAGESAGDTGGSNAHSHDASPAHTHEISYADHTHTLQAPGIQYEALGGFNHTSGGGGIFASGSHGHNTNTGSLTSGGSSSTTTSGAQSGGQTHPSLNHEAAYKTIRFIKQSSVGLRNNGIPPGGIIFWHDVVANIPSKFQVSDGTNSTSNYLSKYPKGTTGTPGTTGGANTHQHTNPSGSHTHSAVSMNGHTHGSSGSTGTSTSSYQISSGAISQISSSHTHSYSATSSSNAGGTVSLDASSAPHTHDSLNHQPPTIALAYIERLKPQ